MPNLIHIKPIHINTIRGYEVYCPDVYYNGLSFLKKNCPLWVRTNLNGDCIVHCIKNENKWEEELENIIIKYPLIRDTHFFPLTKSVAEQFNLSVNDFYNLSAVAKTPKGEVTAIICIDKNEKGEMEISFVYYKTIEELKKLRNHILSDHNIYRFRGYLLKYYPKPNEDLSKELGLIHNIDNGYSYIQLE